MGKCFVPHRAHSAKCTTTGSRCEINLNPILNVRRFTITGYYVDDIYVYIKELTYIIIKVQVNFNVIIFQGCPSPRF